MIKCPKCRTSIPNNSVYCRKCGEKIPENQGFRKSGTFGSHRVPPSPNPDSLKGLR